MTNEELIDNLVKKGYLKTPRIIDAFKKINRADFVTQETEHEAYLDVPLPIGFGKTISQPLTVAFLLELLVPQEGDKILDVGTGSGWQAALLAQIVGAKGQVLGLEIISALAESARRNIEKYKFLSEGRAKIILGDGAKGLSQEAPFDRIIAAAAGEKIPEAWKAQLKIGGRLVAPVMSSIYLLIKGDNGFSETQFPGFAFVPLL